MKSKVIKQYGIDEAVREYEWKSKPDCGAAEEGLYQAALKYKRYEAVSIIASGDIAAVTMQSEAKKFNRSVKLQVGGNLFDRLLEAELIGRQVGKEYRFVHPEGEIAYTVQCAQRLIVPEINGSMVKELGIDGVETPEELRLHYLRDSMKRGVYDEALDFVSELLGKWDFVIDEQDIARMDEYEMERCRKISQSMGTVFDEMNEEQLMGAVGCRNIPEFRAMIHEYHRKSLAAALAEAELSGKEAAKIEPEDVSVLYGAFIDRIVGCVLSRIKEE